MGSWCQRHGAKSNKKGWKETTFADIQKRYWPREEQRNRNNLIGRVGRYFAYYSIILKHTIEAKDVIKLSERAQCNEKPSPR